MAWWRRRGGPDPEPAPQGRQTDPRVERVVALKERMLDLQARGQITLARQAADESVTLGRALVADYDEPVHREQLAASLYGLAAVLVALGQPGDALPVLDECQASYERLGATGRPDVLPLIADVRARRAGALQQVGRSASAAFEIALAAETYLVLTRDPGNERHLIDLARVLGMNAGILGESGEPSLACASADFAIRLYLHHMDIVNASEQPVAYVVSLVETCRVASAVHAAQGRMSPALGADEIAVQNAASLVRVAGPGHAPRLAEAAARHSGHLAADGRPDEAAGALLLAREHDPAVRVPDYDDARLNRTLAAALDRAAELGLDVPAEVRDLAPAGVGTAWAASRRCPPDELLERAAALGAVARRLLPLSTGDGLVAGLEAHAMTAFAVKALAATGPEEHHRYCPGWQALLDDLIPVLHTEGHRALADDLAGWADLAESLSQTAETVMLDPGWGPAGRPDPRRIAGIALVRMRLGERLARIGRDADAAAYGDEAVRAYRALSSDTNLAEALYLQSGHLARTGRLPEALAAGEEAVALYRRAMADDPSVELALARALHQFAGFATPADRDGFATPADRDGFAALAGRDGEALGAALEAVDTYRRVGEPRELGAALATLGRQIGRAGLAKEAVDFHREAVDLLREAGAPRNDVLNDLADLLVASGDQAGAAAARAEVDPEIPGEPDGPDGPDGFSELAVADTLLDLARRLTAIGRRAEAAGAANEAGEIYSSALDGVPRSLVDDHAAEAEAIDHELTEPERAAELNRMGISTAADPVAAIRAGEAAVALYRELAAADPGQSTGLAMALNNLGVHRAAGGDRDGAIAAAEESVAILRRLGGPALPSALSNLGGHLLAAGREEQALAVLSEAEAGA